MMEDLEKNMLKWGSSGRFDPFDDIYEVGLSASYEATYFDINIHKYYVDGFPTHNTYTRLR